VISFLAPFSRQEEDSLEKPFQNEKNRTALYWAIQLFSFLQKCDFLSPPHESLTLLFLSQELISILGTPSIKNPLGVKVNGKARQRLTNHIIWLQMDDPCFWQHHNILG